MGRDLQFKREVAEAKLMEACKSGAKLKVEHLIQGGADVNEKDVAAV